jgi:hypothetical protein
MLAEVAGTPGDDVIRIFGRPGELHVVVNGVQQTTAEDTLFLSTGAGADHVYLGDIAPTANRLLLNISLGDDNDRVTNFDPDTNTGNLTLLRAALLSVIGGGGIDSIGLDDSDSPETAAGRTYKFGGDVGQTTPTTMSYTHHGAGPTATVIDFAQIEQFQIDAGDGPDSVHLYTKYPSTNLALTTGGGDDSVWAGDGQFDRHGFIAGTASLSAGTGNDAVYFDDRNDNTSTAQAPSAVTLAGFTVSKGSSGLTYSGFERVTLHAAQYDVINVIGPSSFVADLAVQTAPHNIVNLLAVPANTTVSLANDATVNVGNGNLSALGGAVTLTSGIGVNDATLNINDQGTTLGHTHTVTAAGYTRAATAGTAPVVVNYADGLKQINVNAGSGYDWVTVASSPAGAAVAVAGNGGNDSLYVARGNLGDVAGPVSLDGGAGADDVRVNHAAEPGFTDAVVTAAAISAAGFPSHAFTRVETVNLFVGQGGSHTLVSSLAVPLLSVTGGQGADVLAVGAGDLDANLARGSTVYFDGHTGVDRVEYDDRLDTNDPLAGPDEYTLDARRVQIFEDFFLRYDRLIKGPAATPAATVESYLVEQRVLLASGDANIIRVLDPGTGLRVEANGGDDAVSVHDTVPGSPVVVHTGGGVDSLDVNTDAGTAGDVPAVVLLSRSDAVSGITVRSGGTLRVGPGAVLTKSSSPAGPFALFGVIDLAGGAMVFQTGTAVILDTLRAAVRAGYNGGAWNGTTTLNPDGNAAGAIHSSLAASTPDLDAVGLAPAAALYRRPSVFAGQTVAPGDLLLRHTLAGDTDLNLRVDALDLARARRGIGAASARWDQGDFTFDGRSDARDLLLLRRNLRRVLLLPAAPGTQGLP